MDGQARYISDLTRVSATMQRRSVRQRGAVASEVTVGIDIGTTSVKALAVEGDGRVVARARVPHELKAGHAGELAHDARRAWRDGVLAALASVRAGLDVRAVS